MIIFEYISNPCMSHIHRDMSVHKTTWYFRSANIRLVINVIILLIRPDNHARPARYYVIGSLWGLQVVNRLPFCSTHIHAISFGAVLCDSNVIT